MCHSVSSVVPSTSYQRWPSGRPALRYFIRRIESFKRSVIGLRTHRISNLERLKRFLATARRVEGDLANWCTDWVDRAMGTCMCTHSMVLSEKRKSNTKAEPPISAGCNKRVKSKTRELRKTAGPSLGMERRVPRKCVMNGTSNVACLFTQQGRKGLNQDAMIVWEDFGSREDTVFCGVFDGHGPFGHLVAQSVRDSLPSKLEAIWQARNAFECSAQKGYMKEDGTFSVEPGLFSQWKETFSNAYMSMDKELRGRPGIDCFCSGTTAVTLIKQGGDVIIGNVGDSRAILGTKSDDGSLLAVQLTIDLKPNLPKEEERIRQCKGRVFALHDEPEVHRVWLPNENSPGLAMARAFGDFCLKNFGVIAVPEVTHHRVTQRDQFIVMATDGVWDVLSNEQVVDIVASVSARPLAARAVVEVAVHAWRLKYPTSKVDDCAVVCLFMENMNSLPSMSTLKKEDNGVDPKVTLQGSKDPSGAVVMEELPLKLPSGSECLANKARITNENENERDATEGLLVDAFDSDWTALEGVTRVNSLVALPRFSPGDMRAGG